MNMIEKAARSVAQRRYGDEAEAMFNPVPEGYPQREKVQAFIDEKRQDIYQDVRAVLRALVDPVQIESLRAIGATDVFSGTIIKILMQDDPE